MMDLCSVVSIKTKKFISLTLDLHPQLWSEMLTEESSHKDINGLETVAKFYQWEPVNLTSVNMQS